MELVLHDCSTPPLYCHGDGKVSYRSRKDAYLHARKFEKRKGRSWSKRMYAYKCPFCGDWHITRKKPHRGKGRS